MKKVLLLLVTVYLTSCSSSWTSLPPRGEAYRYTTSLTKALEGQEAGVLFNAASGNPGASPSLLIRGINSINSSTEPLYILDGMPYDGPLSMINPHDIESVQVLKNPSETSIYGIRGANGVVVIKTKKGGAKKEQN